MESDGTKISELNDASTPFGSADYFPIVQSGATKKGTLVSIARKVLTTSNNGASANYWAKLVTFTLGVGAVLDEYFVIQDRGYRGGIALVEVSLYDALDATDKLRIVSISNTALFTPSDFKMIGSGVVGDPIELWVRVKLTSCVLGVTSLSRTYTGAVSSDIYNNDAPWQAGEPTGTVNIFGDWAGRGTYAPTISFAGAAVGVTYTLQVGFYSDHGGVQSVHGSIALSNKGTSTGQLRVNLPFTAAANEYWDVSMRINYLAAARSGITARCIAGASYFVAQYGNGGTGGSTDFLDSDLTNVTSILFTAILRKA